MGSKPWLKVGSVLLAGMLVCGCQDPPRQNNSTIKMPPPDPAKVTTATNFNGASNTPPTPWPTNNSVAKPASPGFTSGVGGSVTGLPSQTPASFNNSNTLNPTPTVPSGFNTPMPPLNPSIGSTPPSGPTGFASMPPSSSAPGYSSSVPPVNGPTSPGLPAVNYISTPPSAFGPNAGPPARP